MRKGFTLIELSIVLVIIGLLIGGILAAQSMISSAKIGAQVRQIQQYDIAMRNFQNLYQSLPGDSTYFSPPGDGDGIITGSANDADWQGEITHVFSHLQTAGMIKESFTYVAPSDNTTTIYPLLLNKNIPSAKIGVSGTGIAIHWSLSSQVAIRRNPAFYLFGKFAGTNLGGTCTGVPKGVTGVEALAVDTKLDDGNLSTGNAFVYGNGACTSGFGSSSLTDLQTFMVYSMKDAGG